MITGSLKYGQYAGPDDYRCMEEALERRFSHGIREQKEREEKGQVFRLEVLHVFPIFS